MEFTSQFQGSAVNMIYLGQVSNNLRDMADSEAMPLIHIRHMANKVRQWQFLGRQRVFRPRPGRLIT
ncbi:MAG: hypothetical protein LKE96_01235 [Acetobacter peroxydans]|nr:hypothetical protein [Acetobacter peroxydans]